MIKKLKKRIAEHRSTVNLKDRTYMIVWDTIVVNDHGKIYVTSNLEEEELLKEKGFKKKNVKIKL